MSWVKIDDRRVINLDNTAGIMKSTTQMNGEPRFEIIYYCVSQDEPVEQSFPTEAEMNDFYDLIMSTITPIEAEE